MATDPVRVILDTNVWISGIFFSRGAPAQLLREWRDGRFEVFMTAATLAELAEVLRRKTVQFGAPAALASEWLEFVHTYAAVTDPESGVKLSRDPQDDMMLDAASASKAHFLVTGDQDLLVLQTFADTRIVSPSAFLDWLVSRRD